MEKVSSLRVWTNYYQIILNLLNYKFLETNLGLKIPIGFNSDLKGQDDFLND